MNDKFKNKKNAEIETIEYIIDEMQKKFLEIDLKLAENNKQITNHLSHIKDDINILRLDLAKIVTKINGANIQQIENDMTWLKKFFWLIAGSAITALVAAVFGLIVK